MDSMRSLPQLDTYYDQFNFDDELQSLFYSESTPNSYGNGSTGNGQPQPNYNNQIGQDVQATGAQAQQIIYNNHQAGDLPNDQVRNTDARNTDAKDTDAKKTKTKGTKAKGTKAKGTKAKGEGEGEGEGTEAKERTPWNGNIRDMVKFWVPAKGADPKWDKKAAITTTVEDTYDIIEERARKNRKVSDFDKMEMMRKVRMDALIAHQKKLREHKNSKTTPPQGWEGGADQWNYQANHSWTYPESDSPEGAEILQEANLLYRVLSDKEKTNLEINWKETFPDGRPVQQKPEATLEQAYHILVDGHVNEKGGHRTRDAMSRHISTHWTNSVKRDLCIAFAKKCPICAPGIERRSRAHDKRKENAEKASGAVISGAKRQLEDDEETSPDREPKRAKRQATKPKAQAQAQDQAQAQGQAQAQASQFQPQQMGFNQDWRHDFDNQLPPPVVSNWSGNFPVNSDDQVDPSLPELENDYDINGRPLVFNSFAPQPASINAQIGQGNSGWGNNYDINGFPQQGSNSFADNAVSMDDQISQGSSSWNNNYNINGYQDFNSFAAQPASMNDPVGQDTSGWNDNDDINGHQDFNPIAAQPASMNNPAGQDISGWNNNDDINDYQDINSFADNAVSMNNPAGQDISGWNNNNDINGYQDINSFAYNTVSMNDPLGRNWSDVNYDPNGIW